LWGLARMHDDRGELRVGRGLGEQLLSLAQRAQDPALLLEAHHELWANLSARGELVSAHSHMEQGIALYDPQKHRDLAFRYGGHDPGVCSRFQSAEVLWLLGYPDQALRRSQNSLTLARELSHATTMSVALFWTAWFDQVRGEKQSLQARIHEGVALATEQGFLMGRVQATFLQGWLLVEEGHAKTGIAQMFEIFVTEPAMAAPGSLRFHIRQAALLGDAYRKSGQTVDGLNVVNDAIARTQLSECRCYEAELHRIKGELLITQPVPSEEQAEGCFREAIKVARGQSAKSLELRAAMSLCRLRQRQGKTAEAQQLLGDIYGWFTEGFETADLKAAKALLNELT
jgi:predicted ATPase